MARFDPLEHPRGRGGLFVDTLARLRAMDAQWNADKRTWTVDRAHRDALRQLLVDLELDVKAVKPTSSHTKAKTDALPGPDQLADPVQRLRDMGGEWNEAKRQWTVPRESADQLKALLDDLGITADIRRTGGGKQRFVRDVLPGPGDDSGQDRDRTDPEPTPPPDPTPPPPKPKTPEQESLERIRALAATMRMQDTTEPQFVVNAGDRVHLGGVETEVVSVPAVGTQWRVDPDGRLVAIGSRAPDGTWGVSEIDPSNGRINGPTRAVSFDELTSWRLATQADATAKLPEVNTNPVLTLRYPDVPDGEPFVQFADDLDEARDQTLTWRDEVKVREIGQAIREHMDRFAPADDTFGRARRIDELNTRRFELRRQWRETGFIQPTDTFEERAAKRAAAAELEAQMDEITREVQAIESQGQDTDVLRALLKEIRPGFGTGSFRRKGQRKGSKGMAWAEVSATMFPQEWVENSMQAGPLKISPSGRRGHYQPTTATVKADNQLTMTHELGHRLQWAARGTHSFLTPDPKTRVDAAAVEFHKRRVREAGTKTRSLREILRGQGYGSREVANEDRYHHPYVGREYGGDPLEVFTMGLEAVWHRNRYNNLQIKQTDPELWDLIVGMLAGVP